MFARTTFILGGARSGKSALAQQLAEAGDFAPVLIATADARDEDMQARVAAHSAMRPLHWQVVEEPLELPAALLLHSGAQKIVVVDCLTLWLAQIMEAGREVAVATSELRRALQALTGPAILVSNETGLGIVPSTPLGRSFRDAQGRLNQAVAAVCDQVIFVAAGVPLVLKPSPVRISRPGLDHH